MQEVYIAALSRTPLGRFGGGLKSLTAVDLGAHAIATALERAGLEAELVEEVIMGNVCSANLGQAPAKQAALAAGIPNSIPCTLVNKVCSSGMKSVMFAAQLIQLGKADIVVAGGMESMSNIPYYAPAVRWGKKFGSAELVDGLVRDGLNDAYDHQAMGLYAEATAEKYDISRSDQDEYAIRSYKRSAEATEKGEFKTEIAPISVPQRKGDPIFIDKDEEYSAVNFDKIPKLRSAFKKDGSVTAANASTINDGAAALVLVSATALKKYHLKPIGRIVDYADAAQDPAWFTTSPTLVTPKLLKQAKIKADDIDFYEVNEAFSVVPIAYSKILGIDMEKMNVLGGAVSLGHPLGASGGRILCTLSSALRHRKGKLGLAAICNGGGGASAMIIENLT